MAFQVSRMTKPPKSGPLKTEYEFWFENRDRLIEKFPGLFIGIVGRDVRAISDCRHAVYGQIILKYGNRPMVIERADRDERFDSHCSFAGEDSAEGVRNMMVALEQLAEEIEAGKSPSPSPLPAEKRASAIRDAMWRYTEHRDIAPLLAILNEEAENFLRVPWEISATYLFAYWKYCAEEEFHTRLERQEQDRYRNSSWLRRLLGSFRRQNA
ncbi:MAG: hypothetical protein ACM3NH_00655 [Candidatus Saccharibacteria bacterium]